MIETLQSTALEKIRNASDIATLENARVEIFGKKGMLTELMKTLGGMAEEERKAFGQKLNAVKKELGDALDAKKQQLEQAEMNQRLASEKVDVTLPCRHQQQGRIHPISQAIEEALTIFAQMGFQLAEGPDIEDDWHNFTALNTPPDHPARQMQDSFFMANGAVLRTQTSGVQIHTMETQQPPIRIVAPGRTYRRDYDATHTPMFHQIEGLVIDKSTTLANLKSTLLEFFRLFFETDDVKLRFRPSFFPFTEPSFEVDLGGALAQNIGKEWLEMLGCGMVDPQVLINCKLDPNEYQGFAFGMGLDRLTMMKYGIPDLRDMFSADMNWTKHYGFLPLDIPTITSGLSMNGGNKK